MTSAEARRVRRMAQTSCALAALGAFAAALPAQARTTRANGPASLGAVCYVEHGYPVGVAGHLVGFVFSPPFPGAVAFGLGGCTVTAPLRVDPAACTLAGVGVTDGSGTSSFPLVVPAAATLLGAQLDAQSFDLGGACVFELAVVDVTLTVVDGPDAALAMVAIPPGTFTMGSAAVGGAASPAHPVAITRPFWIGRHEVTQAQWTARMGANPSFFQGAYWTGAPQRPVELVSWNDAVAYCAALDAHERAAGRVPAGYEYRLPTEAEWEYCCRAGSTTEWNSGAALSCVDANHLSTTYCAPSAITQGQTTVVGAHPPNAFGLCDMHGNAWEWCLDAWDGGANYPTGAVADPYVQAGANRTLRGGAYVSTAALCRSAARAHVPPTWSFMGSGLRIVLGPTLP
jgi:formylglycine-generating enzyme required for sulfatase activity